MKATFTVEVPDEFIEQRANEFADRHGDGIAERMGRQRKAGVDYFLGRCHDIAADELPIAFYSWPVTITVSLDPS